MTGELLTYYDDATGERFGLSAAELGEWSAATAALLTTECGLVSGDRVGVLLPPHWQTAVVLLGAWSAGMAVAVPPGGPAPPPVPGPPAVDARSGVSARFAIAAAESTVASAVRRSALAELAEETPVARVCDLPAVVSTLRGKVEFEVSEEGREEEVLAAMLRRAIAE